MKGEYQPYMDIAPMAPTEWIRRYDRLPMTCVCGERSMEIPRSFIRRATTATLNRRIHRFSRYCRRMERHGKAAL